MSTALEANAIALGDFGSVESKTLVEKELFNRFKPVVGSWHSRCTDVKLEAPYKTKSFRSLVMNPAPSASNVALSEGVIPDPQGKLIYTEDTMTVQPYGFYSEYTDEDMVFGFDNIVGDLTENIANQGAGVIDEICANAFAGATNTWACGAGLDRETFIKIRIQLLKFTNKKGQKVHAIITPEDAADLRLKYNVAGANLFQDLPMNDASVKDGVIARFEGVDIEEDYSSYMYGDGVRYAYFYVLDTKGRKPVCIIATDGTNGTMIAKALGSSGVGDPLNQKGSVGIKFKGLGAKLTAPECLAKVTVTPANSSIGLINGGYDYVNAKWIDKDGTGVDIAPTIEKSPDTRS